MAADRDPGDLCPSEADATPCQVWHNSFLPARPPVLPPRSPESIARRELEKSRALLGQAERRTADRREAVAVAPPWRTMPELYRRMVVRAAGLGADLVDRAERDMEEREKAMLRSAMADMRTWLNAMVAL